MKLDEFLHEKRWNTAIFSRECKVNVMTLRKIINGVGSINLDTALQIEVASKGKVKPWDLSRNADIIREGNWKRSRQKKGDSGKNIDDDKCDIEEQSEIIVV